MKSAVVSEVGEEEVVATEAEVAVAPSFEMSFRAIDRLGSLGPQVDDHEVRVRDTATTSAALYGSKL